MLVSVLGGLCNKMTLLCVWMDFRHNGRQPRAWLSERFTHRHYINTSIHTYWEFARRINIVLQLMRDTSYRNPQTDTPWCGFSKKHISSVIEPSGFNATAPPQIKILLNSLFGWSQGASQPQILQRSPGIEPTRINVRRDVYFVFCWKHWPRRVRLRISIRCVAHELKSILMRRANSQYVCMYVNRHTYIHTCIHTHILRIRQSH